MWIVEVAGEQPTRIAVGCKEIAEQTRDALSQSRNVTVYEGPVPERDDAEKARAQLIIGELVIRGKVGGNHA